ncbi:GtrA family protein [Flavobacteriaceae bacterium]|nr:GtrA family protein [Flavobacteriaceae bacterium]
MFFNQLYKYTAFGFISFLIDFFLYNFLSFYLGFDLNISKVISFVAGSVNSFILNKKTTFFSIEKGFKEPFKFSILYLFSLLVNYYSHKYLLSYYDNYIPFIVATSSSALINFTGLKFFVFKK